MTRPDSRRCDCGDDVIAEINVAAFLAKHLNMPISETLEWPCPALMAMSRYVHSHPNPRLPAPNKPEAKGPPLSDRWWAYVLFLIGVLATAYCLWPA